MKKQLTPNTTLYPVPVVIVTARHAGQNAVFTVNRIASCNVEPPMLSISVRPARASHDVIAAAGAFVVNLPTPAMEPVSDYVGATTIRDTDKWADTGLTTAPAVEIDAPLLVDCPVNLECIVRQQITLPSHTLFIAEVVAMHAEESLLNARDEIDYTLVQGGLPYSTSVVRERPVDKFKMDELLQKVKTWRAG